MLAYEEAKELFAYDRETGIIKWRKRTCNRQRSNMVAGYTSSNGYIQIRFSGKLYYGHRIAMLLAYGFCDDEMEIDHINHVRNDNRLVNLRFVTRTENLRNQSRRSNNTTGVTGVYYDKARRKYKAQIRVDGADIHLGYLSTLEEAAKARKDADIKYNFNVNHGNNKAM
ncbi:hypothetical protein BV739P1_00002 [Phocaeicola phage BV739P1]|nr:hypothetical protein BV739P1_00002 [Phocaeicola phage BV739P1]